MPDSMTIERVIQLQMQSQYQPNKSGGMMIEFRESLQKKIGVFYLGNICGQFDRQLDGKVIYNCYAEINYTVQSLEQILSKMKELQGEKV